jgi:hypothetical protein
MWSVCLYSCFIKPSCRKIKYRPNIEHGFCVINDLTICTLLVSFNYKNKSTSEQKECAKIYHVNFALNTFLRVLCNLALAQYTPFW